MPVAVAQVGRVCPVVPARLNVVRSDIARFVAGDIFTTAILQRTPAQRSSNAGNAMVKAFENIIRPLLYSISIAGPKIRVHFGTVRWAAEHSEFVVITVS